MSDPLRATTLPRDLHNPATRLGEAIQQYADTLDVAADLIAHDAAMDTAAIVLPAAADRVRMRRAGSDGHAAQVEFDAPPT
jgi:hypothetical protein